MDSRNTDLSNSIGLGPNTMIAIVYENSLKKGLYSVKLPQHVQVRFNFHNM